MTWHTVTELYTVALIIMGVVCGASAWVNKSEGAEVFAFASLLIVFTALSRMISAVSDMPVSAAIWPVQDLILTLLASVMWSIRRNPWKAIIAVLFAMQCGAHVGYWWGVVITGEASRGLTVSYIWIINAVFLVEVAVMGVAGGGVIRRALRSRGGLLLHSRPRGPADRGWAK